MPETAKTRATCPHCGGAGQYLSHIDGRHPNGQPFSHTGPTQCRICDGSGSVAQAVADFMAHAALRNQGRIALGQSMREAAAELGCSPQDASKMYLGRMPFPDQTDDLHPDVTAWLTRHQTKTEAAS